jgi:hypothetical protein
MREIVDGPSAMAVPAHISSMESRDPCPPKGVFLTQVTTPFPWWRCSDAND